MRAAWRDFPISEIERESTLTVLRQQAEENRAELSSYLPEIVRQNSHLRVSLQAADQRILLQEQLLAKKERIVQLQGDEIFGCVLKIQELQVQIQIKEEALKNLRTQYDFLQRISTQQNLCYKAQVQSLKRCVSLLQLENGWQKRKIQELEQSRGFKKGSSI